MWLEQLTIAMLKNAKLWILLVFIFSESFLINKVIFEHLLSLAPLQIQIQTDLWDSFT